VNSPQHVLVTGGAGFIGSHLVERLLETGNRVRVLDALDHPTAKNLSHLTNHIEYVQGDVRDLSTVHSAVDGIEIIFHEAAIASVQQSVDDPQSTIDVNITGTLNVLSAAARASCRRVVIASSAAVYGDGPAPIKQESQMPIPLSPYAISKLNGEQFASYFSREQNLETVCLRYFNVYGSRQDPSSAYSGVISRFAAQAKAGKPATIFGDGQQTRDFVHVSDVVTANILAATVPNASKLVCNVASGTATSLLELWSTINAALGVDLEVEFLPGRTGDIQDSRADITMALDRLGYQPHTTLREGLAKLLTS
jgi:UDP-N-acetylglucosamine/UDP-N-acetyl-alpha-D-glucosaminouronate 4-epimerase